MSNKYDLPLNYFPFLKEGKGLLSEIVVSGDKLDNTNVFDTVLKQAAHEIIYAITKKPNERIEPILYNDDNEKIEVAQFYITLLLLTRLSALVTTRYLAFYRQKMHNHISYCLGGDTTTAERQMFYITMIENLDERLKLGDISYKNKPYFTIRLTSYVFFSSHITERDDPDYQRLKPINMLPYKGHILISVTDFDTLELLTQKLIAIRIKALVERFSKEGNNIVSEKLDSAAREISHYMISKADWKRPIDKNNKESLENDIRMKEQAMEIFTKVRQDDSIPEEGIPNFPPCINRILGTIADRQRPLSHGENILLGSFLVKRGFDDRQMLEFFKRTTNYNEKVTKYNIEYLQEKQFKPMNCDKLDSFDLCYKHEDKRNRCVKITNPMNY